MHTRLNNYERCRREAGLSQLDVMKALNLKSTGTVSMWETGRNAPRGIILVRLAELYKCSVDELLGVSSKKRKKRGMRGE